jgi:hypothetical protein
LVCIPLTFSQTHHGRSAEIFFPGYAHTFTESGKERGWPAATRTQFDAQRGPTGALLIGDAETVAKKILYVNEVLGGISRVTFQMGVGTIPHQKNTACHRDPRIDLFRLRPKSRLLRGPFSIIFQSKRQIPIMENKASDRTPPKAESRNLCNRLSSPSRDKSS